MRIAMDRNIRFNTQIKPINKDLAFNTESIDKLSSYVVNVCLLRVSLDQ